MDLLGFVLAAAAVAVIAVVWVMLRDHRVRERPGDECVAGPAERARTASDTGACIAWDGTNGVNGPATNCGSG